MKPIRGLPDRSHTFPIPNYNHNIYGVPIKCYSGDLNYIRTQVQGLWDKNQLSMVLNKYSAVFEDTYNQCTKECQKEGAARTEANTRLRLYMQKQKSPD